jgi:hypothetical protein
MARSSRDEHSQSTRRVLVLKGAGIGTGEVTVGVPGEWGKVRGVKTDEEVHHNCSSRLNESPSL